MMFVTEKRVSCGISGLWSVGLRSRTVEKGGGEASLSHSHTVSLNMLKSRSLRFLCGKNRGSIKVTGMIIVAKTMKATVLTAQAKET